MLIIIKGKSRMGRTRSEISKNLRKEWGVSDLTPEMTDKCSFVEKKTGALWPSTDFINIADKIKGD